jgi:hypothetical protein
VKKLHRRKKKRVSHEEDEETKGHKGVSST